MDAIATLKRIGALLKTQDNRITQDPVFIVEQKRRVYGFEEEYSYDFEWVNSDEQIKADERQTRILERADARARNIVTWRKAYYIDHWEFVTACFTEKGAEAYIRVNGHNLNETRIWVASGYRNQEWIDMRSALMEIADV